MKYFYLLLLPAGNLLPDWHRKPQRPNRPLHPRSPCRTELMLETSNSDVQVQPMPEDSSVVLLVERDPALVGKPEYYFQKFDQHLRPGEPIALEIPRGYDFQRICAEGTDVYALFSGVDNGTLWVAAYDTQHRRAGHG